VGRWERIIPERPSDSIDIDFFVFASLARDIPKKIKGRKINADEIPMAADTNMFTNLYGAQRYISAAKRDASLFLVRLFASRYMLHPERKKLRKKRIFVVSTASNPNLVMGIAIIHGRW